MQLFAYIIRYCSFIPDTHTFSQFLTQHLQPKSCWSQPTANTQLMNECMGISELKCACVWQKNSFHMRVFSRYSVRFSSPNRTSAFNSIQFDRVVSPPKIGRTDFGIYAKFQHSKFIEAPHYKLYRFVVLRDSFSDILDIEIVVLRV